MSFFSSCSSISDSIYSSSSYCHPPTTGQIIASVALLAIAWFGLSCKLLSMTPLAFATLSLKVTGLFVGVTCFSLALGGAIAGVVYLVYLATQKVFQKIFRPTSS